MTEALNEPTPYEFKRTAERLVSRYFQSWGQTREERQVALSEAAALARVEVDGSNWEEFQEALDSCFPLGKFEEEAAAIEGVLRRFRGS